MQAFIFMLCSLVRNVTLITVHHCIRRALGGCLSNLTFVEGSGEGEGITGETRVEEKLLMTV